ncbi:sugar ABC transporter substrate-binding protein [Wukongibacter baidiensis]|uniref:sugar ABC transporter substrate-binding protein n=1 Tax=Wukongibacter baidiensis TaxID=1723361 RepID=UPI003D7F4250
MKKRSKRLVAFMLVILMSVVVFAGCASKSTGNSSENTEKESKKVIGVAIADFSDQFQVYMMDGMKEEAEKHSDVEVMLMDGKYDANTQLAQVENFVTQGVDAIVVMAVDREAAGPMVKAAVDAKIPVISVNRRLINQDIATSYVGSDDLNAGELEMKAVAEAMGGKGNVAVLSGTYGHEPQIRRTEGYKNILKDYPDIKIVVENTGDWFRDKGLAVTENWLQSEMKIDAIVANNDEMALGAIRAVEEAGLLDEIIVAGVDATPDALVYLQKGQLDFTVFQDAKGQGRTSIKVAVDVINGEQVEKEYDIPFELVEESKVDYYLKKYE